ncbi:hypothetical protein E4U22_004865 [Claviceps purpurea]|uniref:Protein BIG1 n=1 Tax=Claviceps purpurea (strain 20.1) TaxID=1111077 RepID=M1WEF3_CLAP2|nr:hypothetical protein E4U38_005735 [Claviceps purpurea]CCE30004.1 uncharacterized protein CPUR_03851 [Claviceps purpurea 20.1]KAG6130310.1 hypothetical protein E4U12_004263 [Claviceps purpurea]KAG6138347.1 hypothetical protein E4U28_004259 [Claviceps purpurea]KAG6158917.1 hypothetical protein E4U11_004513 [Claviceps purpurea]
MRAYTVTGALTLMSTAVAFSDSSPWVLLSTSKIDQSPSVNQIQTSPEAIVFTKNFLSECPTDEYLIVTQPGVHAADFWDRDGCAMPHLCEAAKDARVKGTYTVAEVVGDVTASGFVQHIKASCNKNGKVAKIIERPLESLSGDRSQALGTNDASIALDLGMASSDSYTILFYATPREPLYDSEFIEPLHMDVRRDINNAPLLHRANETERDTRPLFEKYQFFTPGIFMGIIVALVLLSILGAGIRGLASLEVSYGAFDKDMGPAAQKKQQ